MIETLESHGMEELSLSAETWDELEGVNTWTAEITMCTVWQRIPTVWMVQSLFFLFLASNFKQIL
jgi:hypothetical protein